MAEPRPFGETFFRAIVRAICAADPLNVLGGGCVESVVTRLTHRLVARFFLAMLSVIANESHLQNTRHAPMTCGRHDLDRYGDWPGPQTC
jgi:hypothetical protein